jgi:hypothetical protein
MCDARDCRANAEACIDLANTAIHTQVQSALFDIAQAWMKLAAAIDHSRNIDEQGPFQKRGFGIVPPGVQRACGHVRRRVELLGPP